MKKRHRNTQYWLLMQWFSLCWTFSVKELGKNITLQMFKIRCSLAKGPLAEVQRRAAKDNRSRTASGDWPDSADLAIQVLEFNTYPSFLAHNKFGPSTMAMLLGVILLMSLYCASFARNLIKYLQGIISVRLYGEPKASLVTEKLWYKVLS